MIQHCDIPDCTWSGRGLKLHKTLKHKTKATFKPNGAQPMAHDVASSLTTIDTSKFSNTRLAFELWRAQSEVDAFTEEVAKRFNQ